MSDVEDIKQKELTASQREVLVADGKRWRHLAGGGHLDDWLAFGPGLLLRRMLAMKIAYTNRPEGKGYAMAFAAMMKADGLDTMDKESITAVLWLNDDAERMNILREVRDAMTPGERSRLNSPISARQRVDKLLKARAGGTEGSLRSSPVTNLKARIADLERELAQLKTRDEGSLFDLKRDGAEAIAAVMTDPANCSEPKARRIIAAMTAALKARQKHAG